MEQRLYEVVQKEWDNMEPTGNSFAMQTKKDVSSSVICEEDKPANKVEVQCDKRGRQTC